MILCILTLEELLAFLSYVPWSKYNLWILTITSILQYEVLATDCEKQSDPRVLYALHTEFVLITWHTIQREEKEQIHILLAQGSLGEA